MINQITIVGRLGQDVEMRQTKSGGAVASFSVATTESWKDKNSGEKQEKTTWHSVTAFGRLAEICGDYLHKGSLVYVQGRMEHEKYTDKAGIEKFSAKIIANQMKMLGGKGDGSSSGEPAIRPDEKQNFAAQSGASNPPSDFDDDIPF